MSLVGNKKKLQEKTNDEMMKTDYAENMEVELGVSTVVRSVPTRFIYIAMCIGTAIRRSCLRKT